MPPIPLPLADDDPDGRIDLQAVFQAVYESSGYSYSLPYKVKIAPKLRDGDVDWVAELLAQRKSL